MVDLTKGPGTHLDALRRAEFESAERGDFDQAGRYGRAYYIAMAKTAPEDVAAHHDRRDAELGLLDD
ncbi:hypothetical protein [Nocardia sp. IFM 10818]